MKGIGKMKRVKIEEFINKKFIVCSCGYNNHKQAIDTYGTCIRCNKILNERAYFKFNLRTLTKSWRVCNGVR